MIVKPNVTDLLKIIENRYSLVIATSKRARQIEAGKPILIDTDDKVLVSIAIKEIEQGMVRIIC